MSLDLSELTLDELLEELKKREYVHYENDLVLYHDPVLDPTDGLIHIYDLRDELIKYNSRDPSEGTISINCDRCKHYNLMHRVCFLGYEYECKLEEYK